MPDKKREGGFTFIEMISVLIIIAIVSAIAISRMTSTAEIDNKANAEALKGHIRYVQMRAMNTDITDPSASGCSASYGISMSASSYFMFRNCNTGKKVPLPGANADVITLTGITLSPSANITFDRFGRPCSDLNGTTPNTSDVTITLGTETISITKNTGFVP